MFSFEKIKKSLITALWFIFLTFPLLVMKVNTIENTVIWRWKNILFIGVFAFVMSLFWDDLLAKRNSAEASKEKSSFSKKISEIMENKKYKYSSLGLLFLIVILFPFIMSMYQTNIIITALMYVVLGLGLNIVVGFGGLLHLGYAAFYAVGAYTYGLLYYHFGFNFWICIPIGALLSAVFGILLGIPVLRLRGDYLAIVTLAFGEIVRLVLENWNDFSFGPSGIANIPRPLLFGHKLRLAEVTTFTYFITIALTILTILIIRRIESSKIGRAWEAMREDEIACQAMGIDIMKTKLAAFSMGAIWAGIMGVLFAAKNNFYKPGQFHYLGIHCHTLCRCYWRNGINSRSYCWCPDFLS